jgi:hypothetical protein
MAIRAKSMCEWLRKKLVTSELRGSNATHYDWSKLLSDSVMGSYCIKAEILDNGDCCIHYFGG